MSPAHRTVPENTSITIVPKEISADAVKASATEKVTPMMQHYPRTTLKPA